MIQWHILWTFGILTWVSPSITLVHPRLLKCLSLAFCQVCPLLAKTTYFNILPQVMEFCDVDNLNTQNYNGQDKNGVGGMIEGYVYLSLCKKI